MSDIFDSSPFECPICLEFYSPESPPVTFPCGHGCCMAHSRITKCFACGSPVDFLKLKPSYALRDATTQYLKLLHAYESLMMPNQTTSKSSPDIDMLGETISTTRPSYDSLRFLESEKLSFDWNAFGSHSPLDEFRVQSYDSLRFLESEKLSFDWNAFGSHTLLDEFRVQSIQDSERSIDYKINGIDRSTGLNIHSPSSARSTSVERRDTPQDKSSGPASEKKLSVEELLQLFGDPSRK